MAAPQTVPPGAANMLRIGSAPFLKFMLLTTVRLWRDMTMDCSMLYSQVKLQHFSSWKPPKTEATFGTFHVLPKEMVFAIFEHSPLDALMKLRQTNSYAKYIVESWLPFRWLVEYGPEILRAAIAIKASRFLMVERLLAVTFGDRCQLCGEFGTFVQLMKCVRCCFYCLSNDRRLLCVDFSWLSRLLNPTTSDGTRSIRKKPDWIKDLSRIRCVLTTTQPSFWGKKISRRHWAFDYTCAIQLFRPLMSTPVLPSILQKRIAQGTGRPCYYEIPPLTGQIHPHDSHPMRYMAAIHQCAMIKTKSGKIVSSGEGMLCTGCRSFWGLHSQGRHHTELPIYNSQEIGRHLASCPYAKLALETVLRLIAPSPLTRSVGIPMVILLIRLQGIPRRRSNDVGEMPDMFRIYFEWEYTQQKRLSCGDTLIEETQAKWALARELGPSDMRRYMVSDVRLNTELRNGIWPSV